MVSEEGELVTFTADAAPESRSAEFSFHCGLEKVRFSISQLKKDMLYPTGATMFSVPAQGCIIESNCEYETIVSDSGKE